MGGIGLLGGGPDETTLVSIIWRERSFSAGGEPGQAISVNSTTFSWLFVPRPVLVHCLLITFCFGFCLARPPKTDCRGTRRPGQELVHLNNELFDFLFVGGGICPRDMSKALSRR